MKRELKLNKVIEGSFHRIKAATGIKDLQEILQFFLHKESTYAGSLA